MNEIANKVISPMKLNSSSRFNPNSQIFKNITDLWTKSSLGPTKVEYIKSQNAKKKFNTFQRKRNLENLVKENTKNKRETYYVRPKISRCINFPCDSPYLVDACSGRRDGRSRTAGPAGCRLNSPAGTWSSSLLALCRCQVRVSLCLWVPSIWKETNDM